MAALGASKRDPADQKLEEQTGDQTEAAEEKAPEIDTENLNQPEKREWFAGVYLPRHCPEAVNKGEFVIPTKTKFWNVNPTTILK